MRYKELKEKEIFKQAKYIKYVDVNGKSVSDTSVIKIAPVLFFQRVQGNGLLVKLRIYDTMPEGYKTLHGAVMTPAGFKWIYNGNGVFSSVRRRALLRVN